jgi:glycine oxidase
MPADAVVIACGAWSSLLPIRDAADGSESSNREGGRSAAGGVRAPGGAAAVPRIEPVRGQIVCFAPTDEPLLRHVVYSPRGYLVPRRDGRLLAGTTTERVGFDKSVTDAGRRLILSYAEEIAPALARLAPAEHWAGLRPHAAADDLPVIGEDAEIERLFFATGHYRNGILLAPLTGALVAEAVASGVPHPALAPFSPARPTRAAAGAV